MNGRVRKLREQSVNTKPYIASERAVLITEFYKNDVASQLSAPVRRALAFKHVFENKTIYIGDGELIVGERGPAPKAVPTYPEICCHSLEISKSSAQEKRRHTLLTRKQREPTRRISFHFGRADK